MKKYLFYSLSILLLFMHPGFTQECGMEAGTLVIKGGGPRNSAIVQAIKDNMGGESGPLVLIPTASESEPDVDEDIQEWVDLGFTDVSVLHTRDPAEANTEEFIQPLLKAKAVFMGGGRQWRLADSYNGTRTLVELKNLLLRGGVIAGSSAGATIQGSFLPRGDEDGSCIMISNEPEHLIGFGFMPNVAIDVHVDERDRWTDLCEVLEYDNTLLGIGISKLTAIVVKDKTFSIVGTGKVAVYTWGEVKDCAPNGECYLLLEEGDWYDLCKREQTEEPVRVPCPSCHQKRTSLTAIHVAEAVCSPVAHRQVVLTIPKRLRLHTRDPVYRVPRRKLLGKLSSCAWTCLEAEACRL